MSLSEREQQALQSIGDQLADADPGLASMLATFTRLTAGEALPARENIATPGFRPRRGMPALRVHMGPRYAWALLWLGAVAALIAVALVLSHGNGRAACAPLTIACIQQVPGRATGTVGYRVAPAHSRENPARLPTSAVTRADSPARPIQPPGQRIHGLLDA